MSHPPISHVAVVIPAMNEAQTLAECLDSVFASVSELTRVTRRRYSVSVVLVLDSCTDASAEVASRYPELTTLVVNNVNVGQSRAEGVRTALEHLRSPRSATWIANTDADSRVASDWLVSQVFLADAGADVLLGTVEPCAADLSQELETAWNASHPHGRALGNAHGANLGVRASSYLRVGGFAAREEHEDVDLVERLRALDVSIVSTDSFPVVTSGRTVGRTPGGYAGYLSLLGSAGGVA